MNYFFTSIKENFMTELFQVIHTNVFPFSKEGGNPAPIVLKTENLNAEEMQAISKYYNLETAFIINQDNQKIRLRYFVPNYEMEMCVHATIGTITALLEEHAFNGNNFTIETKIGSIKGEIKTNNDEQIILIEQFDPVFSTENPTQQEVASALQIDKNDVALDVGPIQSVSCSRAKLIVPVKDYSVLAKMEPNFRYLWEICDKYKTTGFYPFTIKPRVPSLDIETRQFPNNAGFKEDPATGVAASALTSYLTHYNVLPHLQVNGTFVYKIGQGFDMNRPSIIHTQNSKVNNKVSRPLVGGNALIIKKEEIRINKGLVTNLS